MQQNLQYDLRSWILTRSYELLIKQQPKRARMAGFGVRDRRPVDPPPILQLVAKNQAGQLVKPEFNTVSYFIVHASLWSTDNSEQPHSVVTAVPSKKFRVQDPSSDQNKSQTAAEQASESSSNIETNGGINSDQPSHSSGSACRDSGEENKSSDNTLTVSDGNEKINNGTTIVDESSSSSTSKKNDYRYIELQLFHNQVLLGTPISPAHLLLDPEGGSCIYFVFAELCIRSSGNYRLKFQLFDLSKINKEQDVQSSEVSVTSDIFKVYSPKTFPGMEDSTELTKCVSRQGVRIYIRGDGSYK